jgi:RNA polymerase sigma factor (sigma-70 family)
MGALEDPQRVADRPSGSPSEEAARNEAQRLVLAAVSKLPEDQKEAFELKFKDQLTYREIAQVTGKSLGSVSRLITAALASVREQIGAGLDLAQEA